MIPPCDGMDGEWKKALRLVRAAHGETPGAAREAALAAARAFLSGAADARLRSWARLLPPGADDKAVLCALVPLERADARARLSPTPPPAPRRPRATPFRSPSRPTTSAPR